MDLNRKVELSIRMIREFAEKWSGVYIAFSGGKDSTALLLLADEALPTRLIRGVVFVEVTGNTDRCNIDYVYKVVDRLGLGGKLLHLKRKDLDFFDALMMWGVPHRKNRWCYQEFKQVVMNRINPPVYLVGVKHSDSRSREKWGWDKPKRLYGQFLFSPIWFWSSTDVRDYLRSRNADLSPCYEKFGHSGNCMYCPFHKVAAIRKTVADPYWGPLIISALAKLRNEWGKREFRRWYRFYTSRPLTSYMNK